MHYQCFTSTSLIGGSMANIQENLKIFGTQVRSQYRGCRGIPFAVVPRQCSFPSDGITRDCRWQKSPPLPHAAITRLDSLTARFSQRSFRGPIGSMAWRNIFGCVARIANRFTNSSDPNPQLFAKFTHLRSVGSSEAPSAVEGLRPIKVHWGSFRLQMRRSQYRYVLQCERPALDKQYSKACI